MIKKLKKHEDIDIKDLAEKIFDHWKQISEEAQLRRKARQAAKLAEKRKQEHKAEKDKEAKALKKMKASGPTRKYYIPLLGSVYSRFSDIRLYGECVLD